MSLIYRVLGITAAIAVRLNRIRINFIPVSALIWLVLLMVMASGVAMISDGQANFGKLPLQTTPSEVVAKSLKSGYVVVRGRYDTSMVMEETKHSLKTYYVPLIDSDSHDSDGHPAAVIVSLITMPDATHEVKISGELSPSLSTDTSDFARFNQAYHTVPDTLLMPGYSPSDPGVGWALLVLAGIPLFLMSVSMMKQNVIVGQDQPVNGSADASSDAARDGAMRYSGALALQGATRKRFVYMPAALVPTAQGNIAVASNIDASTNTMLLFRQNRSGVWFTTMDKGSIEVLGEGVQYFGLSAWPCLRVQFTDPANPYTRKQTAVLAFNSEEARQSARQILDTGFPAPAAPQVPGLPGQFDI